MDNACTFVTPRQVAVQRVVRYRTRASCLLSCPVQAECNRPLPILNPRHFCRSSTAHQPADQLHSHQSDDQTRTSDWVLTRHLYNLRMVARQPRLSLPQALWQLHPSVAMRAQKERYAVDTGHKGPLMPAVTRYVILSTKNRSIEFHLQVVALWASYNHVQQLR